MSRSRRRSPICGITTARSDKTWKRNGHRAIRAGIRTALADGREPENDLVYFGGYGEKDGKQRFNASLHPALMRK